MLISGTELDLYQEVNDPQKAKSIQYYCITLKYDFCKHTTNTVLLYFLYDVLKIFFVVVRFFSLEK